MAPRKTQKKKDGKIVIKKTPLLPGHLSPCHPRYDGTRSAYNATVKGQGARCLPAKYHSIIKIGTDLGLEPGAVSYTHKERVALKESSAFTDTEKQRLLKTYFRPEMPAEWFTDPDAWLSSLDIDAVMCQYEEAIPSFKFLGVVPIDFSSPDPERVVGAGAGAGAKKCIAEEYCKLDLAAERARGIRTIGCVFNMDPSDKSGSHWIACAILLKPVRGGSIYYFDSYGTPPPHQIARFMRSFILQDPTLVLKYNGRRFQYGGSECGMYSMYFIICMLNRVPFQRFVRHTVADKYMLELRKILFS
jgi:hypothetical protein